MMKNCLVREMQFRANFVIRLFTEVLWLGMQYVYVEVIYGQANDVGGWGKWEMVVLLGTNHLINQVFEALFFDNCSRVVDQIRMGDLDFVLVKPLNSQFLVSVRYTDYASLMNSLVGVFMIGFALDRLGTPVTLGGGLLFALLVMNGVFILYAMMFMLSALTFWIGRSSNLFELYYQLGQFARNPAEIYRWGLRLLLITLIPMLVVSNYPASQISRGMDPALLAYAFGIGLAFFGASVLVWKRGLQRYRSASS
jgi:ABC-2 type transport system permease protein